MTDRITIEGRDLTFDAYIARPKASLAPAVVVLQELFGVNADIRKTCDELAEQGFLAVAPDLFWRQEPGVGLSVTSEPDWQHGLRLRSRQRLPAGQTPPSTAIRASVTLSLATMERTTASLRQRLPTSGQACFYINNCGDLRSCRRFGATATSLTA